MNYIYNMPDRKVNRKKKTEFRPVLLIICFLTALMTVPASEVFFCVDGPLRIRKEPGLSSEIIGRLRTFEYALVDGVDSKTMNIDGIPGSWIKIRRGDDTGWVYGGYGVLLKENYPLHDLSDLETLYPSSWKIEKLPSFLMSRNGVSQIIFQYFLNTGSGFSIKHDIYIRIRDRETDLESLAERYGLELIRNATSREVSMGMGGEYQVFRERGENVDVLSSLSGERILYFQDSWDSSATTDIAAYLGEADFSSPFGEVMFCYYNLWPDGRDPSLLDIDNAYIDRARERGEVKSGYYQIVREIMKRVILEF